MAAAETQIPPERRRGPLLALIVAMRPKQWTKNLLLFAGLLFTLDKGHVAGDTTRVWIGFALFCLLSSVVYLINDVADRESDRRHPKKKNRPIARGEISPEAAITFAVIFAVVSLAAAYGLDSGHVFFWVAAIYFLITVGYSFHIKHVVILDVMVLAAGFVLRALAGVVVLHAPVSPWFLLCILMLALLLGLCKRRAELLATKQAGIVGTRKILGEYSAPMLDQMIVIVSSAVVMSYSLYTIQSDAAARHHWLVMTIPFVIYGVFRYLYLMHRHELGESPDAVILEDRPTLINVILWVVVTAYIFTHPLHFGVFQ